MPDNVIKGIYRNFIVEIGNGLRRVVPYAVHEHDTLKAYFSYAYEDENEFIRNFNDTASLVCHMIDMLVCGMEERPDKVEINIIIKTTNASFASELVYDENYKDDGKHVIKVYLGTKPVYWQLGV